VSENLDKSDRKNWTIDKGDFFNEESYLEGDSEAKNILKQRERIFNLVFFVLAIIFISLILLIF
jgi:hypothetical protein